MYRLIDVLRSPEDSGSGSAPIENAEQSVEDFLLSDDDDDSTLEVAEETGSSKDPLESSGEGDSGEDKEEDSGENLEDEIEEDLKEVDNATLELMEPVRRAEILKVYPDLFKKFPQLEKQWYREQKYTEIFPTPNEAKEAASKASALDNFESSLMQGDSAVVFQAIKNEDVNAFHNFVDNLLVNLGKVDEPAQLHVIRNVGKVLIREMINEGQSSENHALQSAALILNQFLTGSSTFQPPTRLGKGEEVDPARNQIQQERAALVRERFDGVRNDLITKLDTRVDNTLKARIDPNESMTPYMKTAAIRDAKVKLQQTITSDTRFQKLMSKAWERAHASNYSKESVEYLRNQYATKAQILLPAVIKSVRAEALRGIRGRVAKEELEVREPQKRGPVAMGKSASPNSGRGTPRERAKAIPAGKSTRDFLMQD